MDKKICAKAEKTNKYTCTNFKAFENVMNSGNSQFVSQKHEKVFMSNVRLAGRCI